MADEEDEDEEEEEDEDEEEVAEVVVLLNDEEPCGREPNREGVASRIVVVVAVVATVCSLSSSSKSSSRSASKSSKSSILWGCVALKLAEGGKKKKVVYLLCGMLLLWYLLARSDKYWYLEIVPLNKAYSNQNMLFLFIFIVKLPKQSPIICEIPVRVM